MTENGIKILRLMFREGETVCVSPNKYGYHSIPLENAFKESVTLVSPDPSRPIDTVHGDLLTLVALNPIQGFRMDQNCYRYRNFLVEIDTGELKSQVEYVKNIGLPYSAMIFSGNKSIHTLISLDQDIPSEKLYRLFSEWILNVATMADHKTKNPSRSIRIPGGIRDGDVKKTQRLIEFRGPVLANDLLKYLNRFEHVRPQYRERRVPASQPDFNQLDQWVVDQLTSGIDFSKGRNNAWFSIACSFCLAGYSEEETIANLTRFFQEEPRFREKEWLTSIRSAFKHIQQR